MLATWLACSRVPRDVTAVGCALAADVVIIINQECLRKNLFGLPAGALREMEDAIGPTTAVFLYNFETKMIRGGFRADGEPKLNIDSAAWTGGGGGRGRGSRFPAQLRVRVAEELGPARITTRLSHGVMEKAQLQAAVQALQ